MLTPNFYPFPELTTNRLLLNSIRDEDAEQIFLLRTNDRVMQYIDRERPKSVEDARIFLQKINASIENNESIMWAIRLQDAPGKLVGLIGFWRIIKEHYRSEIGYMLNPDCWNKGIMTEALQAAISYGFNEMKLHSIEAHINPINVASGKVLDKTGFTREAYFKEDRFFKGSFIDSAIYAIREQDQIIF